MIILEASIDDVPKLCTLVNSAYRGDSSRKGWTTEADLLDGIRIDEEMLAAYINDNHSIILQCMNYECSLVGCVYLKVEGAQMYLGMLTVAPEFQAKGIGKLLLKASEEHALKSACTSLKMTVITSRSELIAWYERNGYRQTGERQPFPNSERFGKPKTQLEFLVLQKYL
ncbi:MAG: GNAT family N-acetyltransferase [Bacteroidota bacterium]|nr:GNAT family N-acetyltransferase [Bacteroidota bacterium]